MVDILPGPAVAQGTWESIGTDDLFIPMQDGSVLDWDRSDGSWRLLPYDPANKKDILPAPALNSGAWPSIVWHPHYLIKMGDGRVLDWNEDTGEWWLRDYSPKTKGNILPSLQASGQWKTIVQTKEADFPYQVWTRRLIAMPDGSVLDWGPREKGQWRLWSYAPGFTPDVLPTLLGQGTWQSIVAGAFKPNGTNDHRLITMADGHVLDWVPADGSYRLWNYDPYAPDILPGKPVAQDTWPTAKWGSGGPPDHLVVMQDGRVLAWTGEGAWSLWDYAIPRRQTADGSPYRVVGWWAEADPLSKVISASLYATIKKPRPPVTRVRRYLGAAVRGLPQAERRQLSAGLRSLKAYVNAIEAALRKR